MPAPTPNQATAPADLLAIDLGTSSVKVGLFDPAGNLLRFARNSYPLSRPHPGWVEQDPEAWWAAVRAGVQSVLNGHDPRTLKAVCAGGQGPTLVLVDHAARPVRPAISWLDQRADLENARLAERLGIDRPLWSLIPRLLWVAEHEPATFARTRWALQSWDFVGHRLAGGGDVAAASSVKGDVIWPAAWLDAVGLGGTAATPPDVPAGTPYGETHGPWVRDLGLPDGIPVVGGVNDGIGALVGADGGVVGRAVDPGGASGGLGLCTDRPLEAPGVDCWPGLRPDTYIVGGAFAAGGRALDWWAGIAAEGQVARVLDLAKSAPAGANDLVFQPFLAGERSPLWDPAARGAFLGLTFEHQAPHFARAVLESAGYSLRLLAEAVVAAGGHIDHLWLCGRQAESRLWNQVKADITGYTTSVPRVVETALMGSAIHAAVGAGLYPDAISAGSAMVHVAYSLDPTPAHRPLYDALFATYQRAYHALCPAPHSK